MAWGKRQSDLIAPNPESIWRFLPPVADKKKTRVRVLPPGNDTLPDVGGKWAPAGTLEIPVI